MRIPRSAPDALPAASRDRHHLRAHRFAPSILGLLLAAFTLPVAAADTITAIEITGNRTVEASSLRGNLALKVGSPYDAAKADQSIKALYATGLFPDVRIDRRGSIVHVTVVESPVVARVELEGNAAIDKSKLQEQIQLKPGTRYTASKAHADAVRIREAYRRLGRIATTVEPKVTSLVDEARGRRLRRERGGGHQDRQHLTSSATASSRRVSCATSLPQVSQAGSTS